ncbi:MAG: hypothetical protein IKI59_08125 [Clostridia bacterium]|nr:hypothetical protein [Clostridia bacterium]
MIVLYALFALLLLVLLLSVPVVVTATARLSPKGGVVFVRFHLFGAIPVPFRLRLHLLSEPYLSIRVLGRTYPLLSPNPPPAPNPRAWQIERIDLKVTLGIEGDNARTVETLGLLCGVFSMLLPRVCRRGRVTPRPAFDCAVFRLSAELVGLLYPIFFLLPHRKARAAHGKVPRSMPQPAA